MVHIGKTVMTTLILMVVVEEASAKEVGMTLLTRLTPLIVVMTTMLVVMGIGGAEVEAGAGVAVVQAGTPQLAWIELLTSFVIDLRT